MARVGKTKIVDPPHPALSELAVAWYLALLDAGMDKCEERGIALTFDQRFTLMSAAQLALGDWTEPIPEN
jgi:hypothetical protein